MTTKLAKYSAPASLSSLSESDLIEGIRNAYHSTQRAHKEAVANAIVTGMLLSHAKATVVHGNFKNWIKEQLPELSYDTANRYRKLAEVIRREIQKCHSDTFGEEHLCELAHMDDGAQNDILEQIQKFIGERSLTELYFDFEILNRPDPRGGKRVAKPSQEEIDEAMFLSNQRSWQQRIGDLYQEHEDKSWTLLPKEDRIVLLGTLEPLVKDLRKSLR